MTISEIQAVSWENRAKKPSDGVTDHDPLLYSLKKKGRVKTVPGGRVLFKNIRYTQNAYGQFIDATEEIAMGFNQTMTAFEFSPKIFAIPVVINILEKAQNMGEGRFLDLLKERNEVADSTAENITEYVLQGDGSAYGGKCFAGIQSYIVTSTSTGTIGGLARSTYSAIRNIAIDAPTTFSGATDSSNIESHLRYAKNKVLRAGGPELVLMGETYYLYACDAASAKQRIISQDQDMLKMNFDNVVIEGMTCVNANGRSFSGLSRIGATRAYGIRLDNFFFEMYKGYNFQPTTEKTSYNQLVDASLNVAIGNFTTDGPGLSFVMYDA